MGVDALTSLGLLLPDGDRQPFPKLKYGFALTLDFARTPTGGRDAAGGSPTEIRYAVTKVSPIPEGHPVWPMGPGTMLVHLLVSARFRLSGPNLKF